ncbi:MAG TPA: YraN family protein [Myxococcales bacterium]|nr:YraN family protein [Myxococcales bacterium]
MKHARQRLGDAGEAAAAAFLEAAGYLIIARNHRCRRGEVDLIAEQGEILVFVEVRTRETAAFGGPEETVNFRKQQRVVAAAQDYLMRRRGPPRGARFDVIAVVSGQIAHYPNAFDAGRY